MRLTAAHAPRLFCFLTFGCLILASFARADLVWTKQTGWRVEGGALSGLAGAEGRNALDQMNKALGSLSGSAYQPAPYMPQAAFGLDGATSAAGPGRRPSAQPQ